MRRVGFGLAVAAIVWGAGASAGTTPPSAAPAASASAVAADSEAEMSVAELDRLLAPLADPDQAKRTAAVKAVSELGGDATRAIEKKILEYRKGPLDVHPVIKAARDLNPGKMGDAWELLDGVLRVKPDGQAYRQLVGTIAMVRALGHIGTLASVKVLIPIALDQGRVFQPEVQTQLRAPGDKAVAALIESRKDPSGDVRRFGSAQLEAMQKKLPGEAVQTKSNQVLADVLRAYGLVRDMDAMGVILSFVNSDRAQVRAAARDSLAAFGQDAIWKLREAYNNLVGKPAPDAWMADQVARELFAAYDRFRLQEVYSLLEDGLAKYKDGHLEDATTAFDKVLARQPMLDRRAEMVPAYVGFAQQIEDADRPRALALFRKALRLDPEGPRMGQIQSEIAYLEGMDLLARGIADADTFRRALALDGGNAKARTELDRLEAASEVRQEKTRRWAAGGAVLALGVACVVLFGGGRRKKRPAPPARARSGA